MELLFIDSVKYSMRMELLLCFVLCFNCIQLSLGAQGDISNVAQQKPITAELTCGALNDAGSPPEDWFGHDQVFINPKVRVVSTH